MGNILRMSPHLANMIAAGEVVERPSSVVKELVENSIDAHAKNIKIIIDNGGLDLIKVIDDGDGMDKEDVVSAFMPHATSKIKTEYDLSRIRTLGFRGEAIASIASVSTMQIISSQDGTIGYQCTYKSGIKQEEGICNSNKGTTVSVDSLFFNTPARLKFMKSAKNELASIMFFVDRIAMAHPELRFSVVSDGKQIFYTTGSSNYKTLIAEVYGIEAAKNYIEHTYACDGYKATLVYVKPSLYRSSKLEITMICNGRYVKNFNVTNAVIEGFSTYLPIGKYPIAVLYFDIDPIMVDVNVHPRKTEIKISGEEELCKKLVEETKVCLESTTHIPTRDITKSTKVGYEKQNIFESNPVFKEEEVKYNSPSTKKLDEIVNDSFEEFKTERPTFSFDISSFDEEIQKPEEPKEIIKEEPKAEKIIVEETKKLPYMEYVGSVFGTYLIFQSPKGMYLMDQHAAAERVNYEKYYEILANPNQPSTPLLVPDVLSFTKQEAMYVEDNLESFRNVGFILEQIGERDYAVREIPLWCKLDNLDGVIYDILSMMIENKKIDIMYFRDRIAKQIACKASIKANHRISNTEVEALIENLNKCKNPYTCPHGRPTIINFSVTDLEKMFERIQK